MRILYYSDVSGKPTFIVNQVNEISQYHDTLYLAISSSSSITEDQVVKFQIRRLPFEFDRFTKRIRRFLEIHDMYINYHNVRFQKQLLEHIQSFQPHIIHCQFGYDALKIFDNYYTERCPFLISFRGFDASNKLYAKTYVKKIKSILSKTNVYTTFVCDYLMNNLKNYGVEFHNKPLILYSNTDTEYFLREPVSFDNIFRFIQISSFRLKKGHQYTIKAFKLFLDRLDQKDNVRLIFTGYDESNPYCRQMRKLVLELGIINNVEFIEWVTPLQAKKLMQQSHVAVQHSVTTYDGDQEGIPNFLMEAMSMELPVISTFHSGIPELIEDQVNGILTNEKDINSYADAMVIMFENWKLYPHNRVKIFTKFEKRKHINSLLSFYENIQAGWDTN